MLGHLTCDWPAVISILLPIRRPKCHRRKIHPSHELAYLRPYLLPIPALPVMRVVVGLRSMDVFTQQIYRLNGWGKDHHTEMVATAALSGATVQDINERLQWTGSPPVWKVVE
jgi:hypothetical protein